MRFYNLISTHRFETIFCHRFNVLFSKDAEKFWCFASENIPDSYAPTLLHETLVPYNKKQEGMQPKMLLYALDELFHAFKGVGANDIDGQYIVAYEILLLASLHCTEWQMQAHRPLQHQGVHIYLHGRYDEKGLKRLAWAVCDGVLLPSDLPELQGQHDWARIIAGTYCLMFRGNSDFDHCLPCTSTSFDATQAAKMAKLQHRHSPPSRAMPPPRAPKAPTL